MNVILLLHAVIVLFYIILPFLPLKIIIKYKLFLLSLIPVILWLIYGECPLIKYEDGDDYRDFFKDIGACFNVHGDFLNILWLVLIPNIILLRLI